jgi:hypothetical protein
MSNVRSKSPFWHPNGHWCGFFHEAVYGSTIHFVWNLDHAKLVRYCRRQFGDEERDTNDSWVGRCCEFTTSEYEVNVIAIRQWNGSPYHHSVLVHECVHAAHNILGSRGFKLSDDSVEAYCYLIDSIYRRCLEQIAASKKIRRKKK